MSDNNFQDQKMQIRLVGMIIGSAVFAFLTHLVFITTYRRLSFPTTGGNDYDFQDFCFSVPSIVLAILITSRFLLRYEWEEIFEWHIAKLILTPLIIGVLATLVVTSIIYVILGLLLALLWV